MNKRHVFVLVICAVLIIIFSACAANRGFYFVSRNGNTYEDSNFDIIVDNETGVNYIVSTTYYGVGEWRSVCPRYNSDGTIYCSDSR